MERRQLENLYLVNGLGDFKLRNLGDLMKVHGINARAIEGYSELKEADKKAYEKFIISMLNGCGLMYRARFIPKAIYRSYQVEYLVKEYEENDMWTIVAGEVWNVDLNKMVSSWKNEDYEAETAGKTIEKDTLKEHLRFEYELDGKSEWLHIINGGEDWY